MKKRIKIIFLLLMFLPFVVNAASTFNEGRAKTGNYITSFENYKRYIHIPSNSSYYAYEASGYNSANGNGFKNGGFISSFEYNLSLENNFSWLSPGIGYWTLSKKSDSEYYYIADKPYSKDKNSISSARITEYVINTAKIKGNGTVSNPWYFVDAFRIRLRSNNESYGNLGSGSNLGPQEMYIEKGITKSINFTASPGYGISSSNISNCYSNYFLVEGNKITIKSLDRDLNCIINFEPKKYTVTLDSNGGTPANYTREVTYKEKYGSMPEPTRTGYSFDGWYTEKTGGSKVTSTTDVTITNNQTLYAHWKSDVITCNNLTYKCSNTSKGSDYKLTYNGKCEVTCENENWKVKFLTSGSLTTTASLNVDVFLVGGGGGGYTKTVKNITLQPNTYKIDVGAGGGGGQNGKSSTVKLNNAIINGLSAEGGKTGTIAGGCCGNCSWVGAGGNYGGGWSDCNEGTPMYPSTFGGGQGSTTCEFGEGTTTKCNTGVKQYSGGGYCGCCYTPSAGVGSTTGAGSGGAGQANTGGGGAYYLNAGSGGSGIVIFRNKR